METQTFAAESRQARGFMLPGLGQALEAPLCKHAFGQPVNAAASVALVGEDSGSWRNLSIPEVAVTS